MRVAAITESRRRTLFDGNGELANQYPVDRMSDIVISFGDHIGDLQGSISVRARILGATPTEVPVENYTIVNDKELKEERKLLFADDTDFFRDAAHQKLLEDLNRLQRATTEYKALLEATGVVALKDLYPSDDVRKWFENNQRLPGTFAQNVGTETILAATANMRRAVGDDSTTRLKALLAALDDVRQDVTGLFVLSSTAFQLRDDELRQLQATANSLIASLVSTRSSLELSLPSSVMAVLDPCATKGAAYFIKKDDVVAKDDKGADIKIPMREYIRVDAQKPPRIVFPPTFEGLVLDAKAQAASLDPVNEPDANVCYARVVPVIGDRLRAQLRTVEVLETNLQPTKEHENGVLYSIENMKAQLRQGIEKRLGRAVRDARVRLATLDIHQNDVVELIVRVSRQGTSLHSDDTRGTVDVEERVLLRVVEKRLTFSTSPQFALIKRMSDVRMASATEVPSNFKPAAGVVFAARVHALNRVYDWLIPSLGISAHVADFDPTTSLELGLGPSLGLLDEHIHLGMGWNLAVSDNREYWWISLDFLRTSETFAALFGGGK